MGERSSIGKSINQTISTEKLEYLLSSLSLEMGKISYVDANHEYSDSLEDFIKSVKEIDNLRKEMVTLDTKIHNTVRTGKRAYDQHDLDIIPKNIEELKVLLLEKETKQKTLSDKIAMVEKANFRSKYEIVEEEVSNVIERCKEMIL